MTMMITKAMPTRLAMSTVKPSTFLASGGFSSRVVCSMSAMWPTSVFMPLAVTSISPRPRVTLEFM